MLAQTVSPVDLARILLTMPCSPTSAARGESIPPAEHRRGPQRTRPFAQRKPGPHGARCGRLPPECGVISHQVQAHVNHIEAFGAQSMCNSGGNAPIVFCDQNATRQVERSGISRTGPISTAIDGCQATRFGRARARLEVLQPQPKEWMLLHLHRLPRRNTWPHRPRSGSTWGGQRAGNPHPRANRRWPEPQP